MFFLFVMAASLNLCSFSQTTRDAEAEPDAEVRENTIEGRLVKALSLGTRFVEVTVKQANGELFFCSVPCIIKQKEIMIVKEWQKNLDTAHSFKYPGIHDLGSLVRVHYLNLSTCNFFLGLEVLEETRPRFIVIASRTEVEFNDKIVDIKKRICGAVGFFFETGFDYGVINDMDFPGYIPRAPEVYVLFAGTFRSYKEAIHCLNELMERDWKYACVKEIK